MVTIAGLSVRIVCDDQPLEEYKVSSEGNRVVSCFVASKAGKNFSMKFGHGGQIKDNVAFYMNIDGVWVAGTPVRKGDNCVQGFVAVSSTHVVRLSFNVVKLTDDNVLHSTRVPEAIGTVEVRVCRTKIGNKLSPQEPQRYPNFKDKLCNEPIPETSKKVGSHQVTLGTDTQHLIEAFAVENIDPLEQPLFTARFHYRPEEILKAQGIIPSSPIRPPKRIDEAANLSLEEENHDSESSTTQLDKAKIKVKPDPCQTSADLNNQECYPRSPSHEVIIIHDSDSEPELDSDTELKTMKETIRFLQGQMAAMERRKKARKGKTNSNA